MISNNEKKKDDDNKKKEDDNDDNSSDNDFLLLNNEENAFNLNIKRSSFFVNFDKEKIKKKMIRLIFEYYFIYI